MDIAVCVPSERMRSLLAPAPPGVSVVVWNGTGDPPGKIDALVDTVGSGLDPRVTLAKLPDLSVVLLLPAGLGTWTQVLADGSLPPTVSVHNGRGIHTGATAELAVAGLLAAVRDLPMFAEQQRQHRWQRHNSRGLANRRVLIVGAGDIGNRIAAAVRVFDARTTLVARTAREGVLPAGRLPDLLPEHDIVVISVPHTAGTDGLVDAKFLAALPDGAILVNIARGPVVVTDDLVAELVAGRLRAVLDVTDPEPLPPDHPLWDAPNLILTPHVAGLTEGWEQRGYRLVREQLDRLTHGRPLVNRVDPESLKG